MALKKEQKPEKDENILTLTSHALVTAKILLNTKITENKLGINNRPETYEGDCYLIPIINQPPVEVCVTLNFPPVLFPETDYRISIKSLSYIKNS